MAREVCRLLVRYPNTCDSRSPVCTSTHTSPHPGWHPRVSLGCRQVLPCYCLNSTFHCDTQSTCIYSARTLGSLLKRSG